MKRVVIRLTPEAEEVYQFLKIKAPVILVDLSTIENTIRYSDTRINVLSQNNFVLQTVNSHFH